MAVLAEKTTAAGIAADSDSDSNDQAKPANDFPDGGARAWLVVAGGWCCLFCSFGWIMCMGVFQEYYDQEMEEYSPSTIAWIPSMQVFLMFLLAPIWGKMFDNRGPRELLIGGSVLHIFGLMMLSLCTEYYQVFLAQGVCSALGTSALFYAGNNTVGRWFLKRRALALGIVSSGSSTGGLVISILAARLISLIGFPWTIRTIAFIYTFLLAIALLTIKTRLEHRSTPFVLLNFIRPLKERAVAITALASFLFFLAVFIPYDYLPLYAIHEGMGRRLALNLLPIANGTSILGRILPSWAGDRFGKFNVMVLITGLSTIFTLAIWIPAKSEAGLVAYAALYGFTSGSFVALIPAVVAQLSSTAEYGLRLGTNSLAVSVAVLIGNPIAGALVTATGGGFIALQIFAGVALFLGTVVFAFARTAQATGLHSRV